MKNLHLISRHLLSRYRRSKGQSLVELALLLPVLLIMVSGMVELGFLMNHYLALIDAARNSARFSSNSLYDHREANSACSGSDTTEDFYFQTACVALQELSQERPTLTLNLADGDDIVVSAITVRGGSPPSIIRQDYSNGWSYSEALGMARNQSSTMSDAEILARLESGAPSTGLILVEIFHRYHHFLGLPWITAFIPNPLPVHVYAFMPLTSAEPTPTPITTP
jgi:hypothetical protein